MIPFPSFVWFDFSTWEAFDGWSRSVILPEVLENWKKFLNFFLFEASHTLFDHHVWPNLCSLWKGFFSLSNWIFWFSIWLYWSELTFAFRYITVASFFHLLLFNLFLMSQRCYLLKLFFVVTCLQLVFVFFLNCFLWISVSSFVFLF